jgi:hypothetical protein
MKGKRRRREKIGQKCRHERPKKEERVSIKFYFLI